ncbi:MAG: beta-lactamase family protein [Verrucomicrobiales bacterium]|nr:beta-lactamase family protein [Verrucomicrobiales bacterium]
MIKLSISGLRNGWFALALLIGAAFPGKGLSQTRPEANLKQFEGRYEYLHGASILIAESPRNGVLNAILDEAKYPLKRISESVFADRAGSRVVFERSETGWVTGYRLHQERATNFFRRISAAEIPETMWFARRSPGNAPYQFKESIPPDLKDGLEVGSLQASGLDAALIGRMVERIANETHKNVDGVLLIKNGKLVLEEYFYQFDRDKLHQLRSATKSVVSALVGIALDRKLIASKEEKVVSFFPEHEIKNPSAEKRAITVEHLLACESGLACEDGNPASPGEEQKMNASPDWVRFILDLPMVDAPGETGRYCTGGVILLGRIVEKASGQRLPDFAAENLFAKLGITNYRWNFKPDNSSFDDACQLHMRPRDMAKIGLLYMNEGKWKGKQVISREWVKASLSRHSVVRGTDYGYLWWRQWLNVNGTRVHGVTAEGNGGQRIYLWPSLDLLVVITGGNYNEQSPADEVQIRYILPAAMR